MMLEWPGTRWNRVAEIGFDSALMEKMERYAKEKGIRKVYVEPSAENKIAIHFYIKNGYKPEAMRRDWYRDGEDSVILGKHLLGV